MAGVAQEGSERAERGGAQPGQVAACASATDDGERRAEVSLGGGRPLTRELDATAHGVQVGHVGAARPFGATEPQERSVRVGVRLAQPPSIQPGDGAVVKRNCFVDGV
jgi:hypothetical protein